uniref:Uncharacterized protein n=2 Tax=Chrysotila carterae TaxID=13221 RepID=A0A6T0AUV6_CHRCT|mmetsp:Transcript_45615/g.99321  ORF Transcript_45615/g.99321 Transcript_45615/m.99321 type:complete len:259 (+) Transcript_45615:295-1071(+)|eukprot:5454610-Pleurochrysis_carterae.AAC.3
MAETVDPDTGCPAALPLASFNAEAHSWILVEDHSDLASSAPNPTELMQADGENVSANNDEKAGGIPSCFSEENSSELSDHVDDSDHDGSDSIAALATSELLASSWPPPLSMRSPADEADEAFLGETSAGDGLANGGTVDSHSKATAHEATCVKSLQPQPSEDCAYLDPPDFSKDKTLVSAPKNGQEPSKEFIRQLLRRSGWRTPLTVVAMLIASHTAAVLVGVLLGRQQNVVIAEQGAMLARRFSSGADGMHARLCFA